jgi:hypothetical protein
MMEVVSRSSSNSIPGLQSSRPTKAVGNDAGERVVLDNSSQASVPRRGTELHRASLLLLTSDMQGLFATFFGAS